MSIQQTETISNRLQEEFGMKTEIKGDEKLVVATKKELLLHPADLIRISEIAAGRVLMFGRSGANFRMIIS